MTNYRIKASTLDRNIIVIHGSDVKRLKDSLDYYLNNFDTNLTELTAVDFDNNGGFKLVVSSDLDKEFPTQKIHHIGHG